MIVHTNEFSVATVNMEVDSVPKFANSYAPEKYGINNNSTKLADTGFYLTKEVRSIDDFDSEYDEEVDEEFSDDEFLPEEFSSQQTIPENDVTKQLLNFAEAVNSDIQKFFGRKAGDEESCDIYQDKWTSGKSGRELYYAELLKIAQGGDTGDAEFKSDSSKSKHAQDTSKTQYSGKLDKKLGIGPLTELFEYGLREHINDKNSNTTAKNKRVRFDIRKYENLIPMTDRKLPRSFWKEPGINGSAQSTKTGVLESTKVIDFSDMIETLIDEGRTETTNEASVEFGL